MKKKFPKIGLALGSGGAKGFAHIGVIKTLEKHHIPIDYITGSSIGAFIGASYAARREIQTAENVILEFNRSQGLKLIDWTIQGGIVKGKKTEAFIEKILGINTFAETKIPFTAIATDINTAESVVFHKGNIVKAIRASIAIPTIFQPISINNRLYADGGLSNPIPVEVLRSMGADITIAVNLDTVYIDKPYTTPPALMKLPFHSINILRHNLALQAVKTSDIIIAPQDKFSIGMLGWKEFIDTHKAESIIKEGERAAEAIIPQLQDCIELFHKRSQKWRRVLSFFLKK